MPGKHLSTTGRRRLSVHLSLLLALLLNSCGNGKTTPSEAPETQATGPNHAPIDSGPTVELNTDVHIEEGFSWEVLGGRVYADCQWQFSSYEKIDEALEITGRYAISFRNETGKMIKVSEMRLVFEDEEGNQVVVRVRNIADNFSTKVQVCIT